MAVYEPSIFKRQKRSREWGQGALSPLYAKANAHRPSKGVLALVGHSTNQPDMFAPKRSHGELCVDDATDNARPNCPQRRSALHCRPQGRRLRAVRYLTHMDNLEKAQYCPMREGKKRGQYTATTAPPAQCTQGNGCGVNGRKRNVTTAPSEHRTD